MGNVQYMCHLFTFKSINSSSLSCCAHYFCLYPFWPALLGSSHVLKDVGVKDERWCD